MNKRIVLGGTVHETRTWPTARLAAHLESVRWRTNGGAYSIDSKRPNQLLAIKLNSGQARQYRAWHKNWRFLGSATTALDNALVALERPSRNHQQRRLERLGHKVAPAMGEYKTSAQVRWWKGHLPPKPSSCRADAGKAQPKTANRTPSNPACPAEQPPTLLALVSSC